MLIDPLQDVDNQNALKVQRTILTLERHARKSGYIGPDRLHSNRRKERQSISSNRSSSIASVVHSPINGHASPPEINMARRSSGNEHGQLQSAHGQRVRKLQSLQNLPMASIKEHRKTHSDADLMAESKGNARGQEYVVSPESVRDHRFSTSYIHQHQKSVPIPSSSNKRSSNAKLNIASLPTPPINRPTEVDRPEIKAPAKRPSISEVEQKCLSLSKNESYNDMLPRISVRHSSSFGLDKFNFSMQEVTDEDNFHGAPPSSSSEGSRNSGAYNYESYDFEVNEHDSKNRGSTGRSFADNRKSQSSSIGDSGRLSSGSSLGDQVAYSCIVDGDADGDTEEDLVEEPKYRPTASKKQVAAVVKESTLELQRHALLESFVEDEVILS
jgi:hypothetical protein